MIMAKSKLNGAAIAALLSLPLATGGASAQQSQDTNQNSANQNTAEQSQDQGQQQSSQSATETGQAAGDQQADSDTVVATVGGAEIRGSDVMTAIGSLPPQLQSQPPQLLVPMALQQLILRELILEQARSQNLASDPEVVALVEASAQTAEEDAMVQVWLDRELANAVTDESVQQVYEAAQAQGQQELPPLEQLRPQIEQHLRQQAIQDVQTRLRQGADVVLYDPSGQPIQPQTSGGTQQPNGGQGDTAGEQSGGGSAGGTSDGQSGEAAGGASEPSGAQSQGN